MPRFDVVNAKRWRNEISVLDEGSSTGVSRDLLGLIREHADDGVVFPPERWAATFRLHAQLILRELRRYLAYSLPPLLQRLIEDAQKIHKQRPILQATRAATSQPAVEA